MKKIKFKPSRLISAMVGVVMVTFVSDAVRRTLIDADLEDCVVDNGRFYNGGVSPEPQSGLLKNPTEGEGVEKLGVSSKAFNNEDIYKGLLVPANESISIIRDISDSTVNLTEFKNESYSVLGENM